MWKEYVILIEHKDGTETFVRTDSISTKNGILSSLEEDSSVEHVSVISGEVEHLWSNN